MNLASQRFRRYASARFRSAFLGPAFDQTTACPVALPGISFDPQDAASVAPFTVNQTMQAAGYCVLAFVQRGTRPALGTSGVNADGVMLQNQYIDIDCRFTVYVPNSQSDVEGTLESRGQLLQETFAGLRLVLDDEQPPITIRQPLNFQPFIAQDRASEHWRIQAIHYPFEVRHLIEAAVDAA